MPSLSGVWSRVKGAGKAVWNGLPGAAKVIAMVGGSVFSATKFYGYVTKSKNGLSSPFGVTLAIVAATASSGTNIVTRFFNSYRSEIKEKAHKPNEATCCYPGIDTGSSWDIGYKLTQVNAAIYAGLNYAGASVGVHAINQLGQSMFGYKYSDKCDDNESDPWKFYLLVGATFYLFYSSVQSFRKYNVPTIRDYYKEFVIQGELKKVSARTCIETFLGVSIGTTVIYFSNNHFFDFFKESMLCRFTDKDLPNNFAKIFSGVTCAVNFVQSTLMTLPAVHKRSHPKTSGTREEYLAHLPTFKLLDKPIRASLLISCLIDALGAFVAVATLPKSIAEREDLIYHWAIISLAGLCSVGAYRNALALAAEGHIRELFANLPKDIQAQFKLNSTSSDSDIRIQNVVEDATTKIRRALLAHSKDKKSYGGVGTVKKFRSGNDSDYDSGCDTGGLNSDNEQDDQEPTPSSPKEENVDVRIDYNIDNEDDVAVTINYNNDPSDADGETPASTLPSALPAQSNFTSDRDARLFKKAQKLLENDSRLVQQGEICTISSL